MIMLHNPLQCVWCRGAIYNPAVPHMHAMGFNGIQREQREQRDYKSHPIKEMIFSRSASINAGTFKVWARLNVLGRQVYHSPSDGLETCQYFFLVCLA